MTAPAKPIATVLSCPTCGHAHTETAWAYRSGYCHACGQKLDIPANSPLDFSAWTAGPHPTAGIILEHEIAVAALIASQDPPPPPNANPPGFGNPSLLTEQAIAASEVAPVVGSVTITGLTPTIKAGSAEQASVLVKDTADNIISAPVTWSSSNTAVATVSATGLVTGVAVGTATITATAGSVTATDSVTIN